MLIHHKVQVLINYVEICIVISRREDYYVPFKDHYLFYTNTTSAHRVVSRILPYNSLRVVDPICSLKM